MANIVKASRYTHAKRGYLVFSGSYPHMKVKYSKTKLGAKRLKKKFEKR
jgi:hypothetical protein